MMANMRPFKWLTLLPVVLVLWILAVRTSAISEQPLRPHEDRQRSTITGMTKQRVAWEEQRPSMDTLVKYLFEIGESSYKHQWPEMKFGWRLLLGTFVGFLGAALGSVGGVGGGGIFVPMLTLIIGFDPKSSTAISKCMITGAAGATVYYNLRMRHPTMDLPVIDYDLALLFQPMLMLGISIGVAFNVMFADWMVTILLILLFLVTSTKAFIKGMETWKKETAVKEAAHRLELLPSQTASPILEYKPLPGEAKTNRGSSSAVEKKVSITENIFWKELFLLLFVWVAFLALQILKTFSSPCSTAYWLLNALQVPVAASVTIYEAISLYKGKREITSREKQDISWKWHHLILYSFCGILAGVIGGLLGLGGGFILGPLFLELGVPPQVASATSTFSMTFSSSMSAVQYYMLDRFPSTYTIYFAAVATVAAFIGQHIVRRCIILLGRASLIIFILATTIFVSAISLGGVGIKNMIEKLDNGEYMGFENLCYSK